jgi:hypothetical protein
MTCIQYIDTFTCTNTFNIVSVVLVIVKHYMYINLVIPQHTHPIQWCSVYPIIHWHMINDIQSLTSVLCSVFAIDVTSGRFIKKTCANCSPHQIVLVQITSWKTGKNHKFTVMCTLTLHSLFVRCTCDTMLTL